MSLTAAQPLLSAPPQPAVGSGSGSGSRSLVSIGGPDDPSDDGHPREEGVGQPAGSGSGSGSEDYWPSLQELSALRAELAAAESRNSELRAVPVHGTGVGVRVCVCVCVLGIITHTHTHLFRCH